MFSLSFSTPYYTKKGLLHGDEVFLLRILSLEQVTYNLGMKKPQSLITFFSRVDVFNRIFVFLAMALFLLLPSYVLFYVKDGNNAFDTTMPCVFVLAVVLGAGVFTLYRPLRTTWFFFLECLFVILSANSHFIPGSTPMPLSENGVIISESIYCILGFAANLFFFFHYKRKTRAFQQENTHNDSVYDFLGGVESNSEIKKDIDKMEEETGGKLPEDWKNIKFSRIVRIASMFISVICFLICVIITLAKGTFFNNQLSIISFDGLFVVLITGLCSIFYPKDYKYMYYYHGLLYSLFALISCGNASFTILPFLLSLIAVFLSLVLTLIVEGRTWTGAKPN